MLVTVAAVVRPPPTLTSSALQMIPALLNHPLAELEEHCHFMPGVPVKPMLAKATNAVTEVISTSPRGLRGHTPCPHLGWGTFR
jgi:DNA ligase-1